MSSSLWSKDVVVNGVRGPVLLGGLATFEEAVVFVHGNPDAGADWKPLMESVVEFAPVVAPDMPGFGGTDKRPDQDYTLAGYAAHLGGVIEQLGIERVHLVAHDFGGPFALTWAAANADRVASVTLINTGVLLDYRWHRMARLWRIPIVGELVQKASTRSSARWLVRHDNPGLPDEWVDRIAGHLMPRGRNGRCCGSTAPLGSGTWTRSSHRCVNVIPTPSWCGATATSTSRRHRPNGNSPCSRGHASRCWPVSATGPGWSNPTASPNSWSRSCGTGSASHPSPNDN